MKVAIKRNFFPGEKWVYYKVYCGKEVADNVLLECVKPLVALLFKKKLINKWFFIRYTDPDNHLRIRFHLNETKNIGSVILEFQKHVASFIEAKQVWDIQLATYKRELERYGKNTIDNAETFFYRDSETVLSLIEQTIDDKDRFIYTLKYLEQIINTFNFSKNEELLFLERYKNQFQREFNVDMRVKKEMNLMYGEITQTFLNIEPVALSTSQKELINVFKTKAAEKKLSVSIEDLVGSLIHMSVNRIFKSKQRMYEMIVYDFLSKKYKSNFFK
uniref:thiopeptide-type bacteriocin biosynthesis protein n=1 Tax=uncultured Tenacibaculum sp. TaxID=174713 RepID=UPI00260CB357|nr:thiopeptide-type bacteriocin biosynthesis protein [uncultured Tenacibaculum sp.]